MSKFKFATLSVVLTLLLQSPAVPTPESAAATATTTATTTTAAGADGAAADGAPSSTTTTQDSTAAGDAQTNANLEHLKKAINEKIDSRDYDGAIELGLNKLPLDKASANIAWLVAYAYQMKDDTKHAIEYYTLAVLLDPEMPQAWCNRALCYEDLNRHDYAKVDLTRAIELDPKNDYAYASRAEVNYVLGLDDECIADARKAIELNPDNAFAYAQLGSSLANLGRFEEALAAHKNTVDRDQSRAMYFQNMAITLTQLKRYDEALKALTQANDVKASAEAYRLRAEVYLRIGEFQKALDDYNAALRIKQDDGRALAGRAVINSMLGRRIEMTDDARAAAKTLIGDPDAYIALVLEADQKDMSSQSRIKYLRRALQTYEGKFDGRLFLLLGNEEQRAGRRERARADFELAKNFGFSSSSAGGNGKR